MTLLANIGTFVFGTYDQDLARNLEGDKVAYNLSKMKDIKKASLTKGSIFGLGTQMGISDEEIGKILKNNNIKKINPFSKICEADTQKVLNEMMDFYNKNGNMTKLPNFSTLNSGNIQNFFQENLKGKYHTVFFNNVSTLDRFKTNFKIAREKDVIHNLFTDKRKTVLKDFCDEIKNAGGEATGFKKFGAQSLKAFGKSMPLIGAALTLGFEIPAVFKSFNDYGAGEGLLQTGRAAFNIGGFAAGAAAGAMLGSACPIIGNIVGGLVGGLVGGFLGKSILGKSKVEEQGEIEALGVQKEQANAMIKKGYDAEYVKKYMMQQQLQQQPVAQANPFSTYSANPMAQRMPVLANHGISLGDENMLSNGMGAYNYYQGMVA